VGSHLCRGLAPLLEFRDPGSALLLVDGDAFEEKNRERQDFSAIGFKALVRAGELQSLYAKTIIVPQPYWVVPEVNGVGVEVVDDDEEEQAIEPGGRMPVNELVAEGDIVFATVDNHAARKLIFDQAAKLDNVDVFTGGNDDAWFGSVYHYRRRDGLDVIEHPAERHPEFLDPPDRNPGEMSCEERAKLESGSQLLATNMAVAALLLARVTQTCFDGVEDEVAEVFFDLGLGSSVGYDRRNDPITEGVTV
jgi:hypothetical protein